MAQSLLTTLTQLRQHIDRLKKQAEDFKAKAEALEKENAELREKTDEAIRERDKAQLESRFMAVSHKLADNPDALVDTRRIIAGLIRNIDRCIAMLKE